MNNLFLSILHGLILGGAYGLIAVGLSVIFGVVRIINFAHGAMLMASAYAYYELFTRYDVDPFLAMIVIAPLFFVIGFLLQKGCHPSAAHPRARQRARTDQRYAVYDRPGLRDRKPLPDDLYLAL